MALTIRMRIDDNDEHQYYYATGSGTEIELIPLVVDSNGDYVPDEGKAYNRVTVNVPSTELETLIVNTNGTYNAPDGKAYNVVQVDVKSIINLQNKSASYTANGNYNIQADSGYDGLGTVSVAVNVPTGGGGSNDFIPSSGFRSVTPLNFNQNKLKNAYVGKVIKFTTNDVISVGDKVIIEGDLMSGSDKEHHYAVWGSVTEYNATSKVTTISVEGSSVRYYSQTKADFSGSIDDYGVLGFTSIDVDVHPHPFIPVEDPDDPYNLGDGMVEVDESQMSSLLTDPTNTRLHYIGGGELVSSGDKIKFQRCEVKNNNGDTIGDITIWGTFGACDPDDDQPYFVFATVDGYTYQPTTGDPITKLAHPCSVTNGEQIVEYV